MSREEEEPEQRLQVSFSERGWARDSEESQAAGQLGSSFWSMGRSWG